MANTLSIKTATGAVLLIGRSQDVWPEAHVVANERGEKVCLYDETDRGRLLGTVEPGQGFPFELVEV